jgi:glycosyltransferase involved in cell wall biosynthesis
VVLHGVWSAANWTISRECLAAGIPYVLFPHGMLDQWSVRGQGWLKRIKKKLYWSLRERRIAGESCAVFFTLQRELDNATKTFRLPAIQALIVVPYGLAPESGDAQMKPSSAVDQGSDRKIGLFLGRVHPTKRPDLLIESWAAAGVPREWRLVIAGPGAPEYLAQLADLARRCRIENSVQFIGPVSGIDKLYLFRRASWFLLPSQHENFGIAVLEAQSSGCAVAVSDQVYLADEFPRGTEILPLSLKAWTRFMRERMIDDTWHDETVRRVREHLGDKFSAERIGKEWTSTILRVLHGG